MPDEGEKLYISSRENSSHSHIQILQLHSGQNFYFFFRGICVVHVQLQVPLLILPKDNECIAGRNLHNKPEGAFPKREMSKFSSATALISVILASGACYRLDYRSHLSLNTYICSNIEQLRQIYAEPP